MYFNHPSVILLIFLFIYFYKMSNSNVHSDKEKHQILTAENLKRGFYAWKWLKQLIDHQDSHSLVFCWLTNWSIDYLLQLYFTHNTKLFMCVKQTFQN